jgi:hypothetical protein
LGFFFVLPSWGAGLEQGYFPNLPGSIFGAMCWTRDTDEARHFLSCSTRTPISRRTMSTVAPHRRGTAGEPGSCPRDPPDGSGGYR